MKRLVVIILALFMFETPIVKAQVSVSVAVGPPVIPVYVQPPCPVAGYMWTPGYWAYDYDDGTYYWVPGVWIAPPVIGLLWTPGYWAFTGGHYWWHGGYWGPHVGFYGGINYGFGYGGHGFYGGRWNGGAFQYNTAVWHVNSTVVHNTYIEHAPAGAGHAAFNGAGGVSAAPDANEQAAMKENHTAATSAQASHEKAMSKDKNQWASVNKGKPATTAMSSTNGQKFGSEGKAVQTNHTAATSSHSTVAAHSRTGNTAVHSSVQSTHPSVAQHNHAPVSHNQPRSQPQHSAPPQSHQPTAAPHGGMGHGGGGGNTHHGGR